MLLTMIFKVSLPHPFLTPSFTFNDPLSISPSLPPLGNYLSTASIFQFLLLLLEKSSCLGRLVMILLSCWVITIQGRRQWQPTPALLAGKSHGRMSLVGCSPWGRWRSGTTERLHFHFSLSCIGEGNGNPLQYSCLENPRDRGAWWAAVYGVAQSRTRLKWFSSGSGSSSSNTRGQCVTRHWPSQYFPKKSHKLICLDGTLQV